MPAELNPQQGQCVHINGMCWFLMIMQVSEVSVYFSYVSGVISQKKSVLNPLSLCKKFTGMLLNYFFAFLKFPFYLYSNKN